MHARRKSDELRFAIAIRACLQIESVKSAEAVGNVHLDRSACGGFAVRCGHRNLQRARPSAAIDYGDWLRRWRSWLRDWRLRARRRLRGALETRHAGEQKKAAQHVTYFVHRFTCDDYSEAPQKHRCCEEGLRKDHFSMM